MGSLVRNCQGSNGTTSCTKPNITRLNFGNFNSVLNNTNRTLSCEIRSDTPLKGEPVWCRDLITPCLPPEHSLENASCSVSNETCVRTNLTLIHVIQGRYDGNYTLTAENDCGKASVYGYINIMGEYLILVC